MVHLLMSKPSTLSELAKMTRKKRETVRTALRRLQRKGLVEICGKTPVKGQGRPHQRVDAIAGSLDKSLSGGPKPHAPSGVQSNVLSENIYAPTSRETVIQIMNRSKALEKAIEGAQKRRKSEEEKVKAYLRRLPDNKS